MANRIRSGVFHSVVGFGLLFATPLFAQNPTAPAAAAPTPPRVVDGNGKFVGWPRSISTADFTNGLNGVERNVNGVWVVIKADPGGFSIADVNSYFFLFTTSDCSGSKYMDASVLPPAGWLT